MTPVHVEQSFTVTALFSFLTFAWEQDSGTCLSQDQLQDSDLNCGDEWSSIREDIRLL